MGLSFSVEEDLLKFEKNKYLGTEYNNATMHQNNLMICLDLIEIIL